MKPNIKEFLKNIKMNLDIKSTRISNVEDLYNDNIRVFGDRGLKFFSFENGYVHNVDVVNSFVNNALDYLLKKSIQGKKNIFFKINSGDCAVILYAKRIKGYKREYNINLSIYKNSYMEFENDYFELIDEKSGKTFIYHNDKWI